MFKIPAVPDASYLAEGFVIISILSIISAVIVPNALLDSSAKTKLVGGKHGHIGLVLNDAKYTAISDVGSSFVIPALPGSYPATVSADAATREKKSRSTKPQ